MTTPADHTYINDTLFIIPARGGSKGIPGKNIKPLGGQPLIHYSIEVARILAPDSHVIVSTDSDEIRSVAEATGLPVPYRRPAELGGDTTGSREVMLDVMDWADAQGIRYD
ncbi:MAG: acylneuraminate cytidylyltransferase family protein, partial [Duncaniella sp.]|nr:acylneuraminate cytidylyltransferase family protein [Duncaniella sp.]